MKEEKKKGRYQGSKHGVWTKEKKGKQALIAS